MATRSCCRASYCGLIRLGRFLQPLLLLAIRLFWGYLFLTAGLGKLTHPSETIQSFTALHIPIPSIMAYLVGFIEAAGGLFLMLGFASRIAALLLAIVMIGAYITAFPEAVENIFTQTQEFVKQAPFNFLMASLIILAFGPGILSIDALLKRYYYRQPNQPLNAQPPIEKV